MNHLQVLTCISDRRKQVLKSEARSPKTHLKFPGQERGFQSNRFEIDSKRKFGWRFLLGNKKSSLSAFLCMILRSLLRDTAMTVNVIMRAGTLHAQPHLMFGTSCKSEARDKRSSLLPKYPGRVINETKQQPQQDWKWKLHPALGGNLYRSQTGLQGLWSFRHCVNPRFFFQIELKFPAFVFPAWKL